MNTRGELLRKFAIRSCIAFTLWMIIFHFLILPTGTVNNLLTRYVVQGTYQGLKSLGYVADREFQSNEEKETVKLRGIISLNGEPAVLVADPCNGMELFALFAGFIVCFPGRIRPKLVYIFCGILALFLLNVFREMALALNYHHFRVSFDFNHKYTYAAMVYLAVLLIWRHWLNHFSFIAKTHDADYQSE